MGLELWSAKWLVLFGIGLLLACSMLGGAIMLLYDWLRSRRRPTAPVVQVQTHTFKFPPTDDDLFEVRLLDDIDPAQTVPFWHTNIQHHVTVKIENGALVTTRVGGTTEPVEANVTLVEFRK
jgi:hypothetical protein